MAYQNGEDNLLSAAVIHVKLITVCLVFKTGFSNLQLIGWMQPESWTDPAYEASLVLRLDPVPQVLLAAQRIELRCKLKAAPMPHQLCGIGSGAGPDWVMPESVHRTVWPEPQAVHILHQSCVVNHVRGTTSSLHAAVRPNLRVGLVRAAYSTGVHPGACCM